MGVEERPIAPAGLLEAVKKTLSPHGYVTAEGEIRVWLPDGTLQVQTADKSLIKQFWPKPTIQDAVGYTNTNYWHFHHENDNYTKGKGYWRFFPDGSVMLNAYGANYYYGPTKKVEEPVVEFRPMARGTDGRAWECCELDEIIPWSFKNGVWTTHCCCKVCVKEFYDPEEYVDASPSWTTPCPCELCNDFSDMWENDS